MSLTSGRFRFIRSGAGAGPTSGFLLFTAALLAASGMFESLVCKVMRPLKQPKPADQNWSDDDDDDEDDDD